jgi:hypothetical protein
MVIYIWPNGEWIYDWETNGFTMKHSTVPSGGRWVDLDNLHAVQPQLSVEERQAICEALGSE